jgi:hypothetical protein
MYGTPRAEQSGPRSPLFPLMDRLSAFRLCLPSLNKVERVEKGSKLRIAEVTLVLADAFPADTA